MKITNHGTSAGERQRTPRRANGFIMIALLVIVTIMLFYVLACSRMLSQLHRELVTLDQTQTQHLAQLPNVAAATGGLAKPATRP